jgi:hypothetical protein
MNISSKFEETDMIKRRLFQPSNATVGTGVQQLHVEELRNLMGLVDASVPPVFNSNRRLWGPIIVFLKSTAVTLIWPIIRIGLRRQTQMNHFVWSLTYSNIQMQKQIDRLTGELAALKAQIK